MAELALTEVTPLLGETWFSGGTVAVFRDSLEAAGLIIVEIEGGFAPGCSPTKVLRWLISLKLEYNTGNYNSICSLTAAVQLHGLIN